MLYTGSRNKEIDTLLNPQSQQEVVVSTLQGNQGGLFIGILLTIC